MYVSVCESVYVCVCVHVPVCVCSTCVEIKRQQSRAPSLFHFFFFALSSLLFLPQCILKDTFKLLNELPVPTSHRNAGIIDVHHHIQGLYGFWVSNRGCEVRITSTFTYSDILATDCQWLLIKELLLSRDNVLHRMSNPK